MSYNSNRQKAYAPSGSVVALNGVTTGTVTAGPQLAPGDAQRVGPTALYMRVSAAITTTSLVVVTMWQASDDGTNWDTIFPGNGAAYVQVAATGNGGLVTTTYRQWFDFGDAAACQYVRAAVKSTGATGAAGDNITITFGWLKRFFITP
ncbi:MAG TPA: hypothetical protein VGI39_39065 [Polyangiaceae bacterium]|jgi:hypothetical protein